MSRNSTPFSLHFLRNLHLLKNSSEMTQNLLETATQSFAAVEQCAIWPLRCFLNVNRLAGSAVGLEAMQNWDRFMADSRLQVLRAGVARVAVVGFYQVFLTSLKTQWIQKRLFWRRSYTDFPYAIEVKLVIGSQPLRPLPLPRNSTAKQKLPSKVLGTPLGMHRRYVAGESLTEYQKMFKVKAFV